MNRLKVVPFLAALIWVAGAAPAFAQARLTVQRVTPPAAVQERTGGSRPHGVRMRADEWEAYSLRAERWRSMRDHLTHPDVNWSMQAARRPGWVRPQFHRRNADPASLRVPDGFLPPDTIRLALLRIDFLNDRDGAQSTGNGRFDLSGPDTNAVPIDRPPRNRTFYMRHMDALKQYYETQAYGRVVIEATVWPSEEDSAYHVSDMADFGPWAFSPDIFERAVHMFRTFFFAADSQSTRKGDRIPWDSYDRFILLHAGSDLQSDVRIDSPRDIPSFTIGVVDTDIVIFPDSTFRPIDRAAVVPETNNQDGFFGALNGVLAHECGHLFYGMADLYDVNTGRPIVGWWSLMDSGNLTGARVALPNGTEIFATGLLPPSMDPFHRQFMTDVFIPFEVGYNDTSDLANSQRFPDVRKVTLSSDEYLLIENRYIAPTPFIELDQDPTTRVILGPKVPDKAEYDALLPVRTLPDGTPLPSGGALVWHIDESVIPLEFAFPLDTSLRANPDLGWNTNPFRLGVSVVEADGLRDLGDPGSRFILGAHLDPFFKSNNATLSDTTRPNLRPHIGTRPHVRLEFLDDPGPAIRVAAFREWQLPAFPRLADFPPGGPQLMAIDADGDRLQEICWAGGDTLSADSSALFAVRVNGTGLDSTFAFARLDRRPRQMMAAIATVPALIPGLPPRGPSLFAVATFPDGPDTSSAGGRVWLINRQGQPEPGWPVPLPSIVTTPPVISGIFPNANVYVGCADGLVYAIGLDGTVRSVSDVALPGGVAGRLAVAGPPGSEWVAAGGADGALAVYGQGTLNMAPGWPLQTGRTNFAPDFLWLHMDGSDTAAKTTCAGTSPQLVAHHVDRVWAFCASGLAIPGWGRDVGGELVASLGAGDPDGDGLPEVLTQTVGSRVGFLNRTGGYSPGWPKPGTREGFRTQSPALALDVDGDGLGEVVALNASGIVAAVRRDGKTPAGWPLASGAGAMGAPVAADLDGDGALELVVPDHLGGLFAYTLPATNVNASPDQTVKSTSWTHVGGDPGRSAYLPIDRTTLAAVPSVGPLVRDSFKAYPNPARRQPVQFAFQLTEPADVQFRIFDTSGHMVTSFSRAGLQSDNLVTWEPGNLPSGLYIAQMKIAGSTGAHFATVQVGLLR